MEEKIYYQELVEQYSRPLYNFCMHLTGNTDAAQDLFQDTFVKAMEKEKVLEKIKNQYYADEKQERTQEENLKEKRGENLPGKEIPQLRNYLIGIAIKLWKYGKRKEAWRGEIAPVEHKSEETGEVSAKGRGPEEAYLHKEELLEVRRQVARLSDKLRIVVVLYYAQEMSTEEIAKQLRIPAATVRSRLHKARSLLKKELEI